MKCSLILSPLALVASSCVSDDHALTIRGVDYLFPAEHKPSTVSEQESGLGAFARVEPPGESFHLIHSSKNYRPNKQGEDVPTIHWVNSANAAANVHTVAGEMVVCAATNAKLHFTCGIRVMDGDLRWAAVFDRANISEAATIHAKSTAYLNSYRQRAAARKRS